MSTTELDYELAANKVRLYPNKTTVDWFFLNVNNARFIYNFFLDVQKEWYRQLEPKKSREFEKSRALVVTVKKPKRLTKQQKLVRERNEKAVQALVRLHKKTNKRSMSCFDMSKLLTVLKNMEGFEWLYESSNPVFQQSLKDLSVAFTRFYSGHGKYPRYHKRGSHDRFRFPHKCDVDLLREGVRLPGVKTNDYWVNCRGLRRDLLKSCISVQSVTVSLDAGKWYASVLARVPADRTKFNFQHSVCGVDVGVVQPVTVSYEDGTHKVFGKEFSERLTCKELRVKHYQRQMSRRKAGSKNFLKSKKHLQTAHQKVRFARHDFVEQTSHVLAQCRTVCFEATKLSNMTRSAKGTVEQPGKSVKAKSGLNRVLLRLSLGKLKQRTEQKITKRKGTFIAVPAQYTSQTCHVCGYVSSLNRKSQAKFRCQKCEHRQNADDNAADSMRLLGTNQLVPWRHQSNKSYVSADRRRKPAKISPLGDVRRKATRKCS